MMSTMGLHSGLCCQLDPAHHSNRWAGSKLDVFEEENGERLDDFIYQVEEFAAFHAWDPVETCMQVRTHL